MLSAALFAALFVTAQPVPMGPISPASLPPPPMPVLGPLGKFVIFDLWAYPGKGTLESCRAKALAAVAAQQGFRFAEITGLGYIAGYTNTARILVYVASANDAPMLFVLVASRNCEDKGLATKIGNRISWAESDSKRSTCMGALCDPDLVTLEWAESDSKRSICMGTPDPELDRKLLPINLYIETHSKTTNLYRHYVNAASLYVEKQGFEAQRPDNNSIVFTKSERLPAGLFKLARRNLNPINKREDLMLISNLEKEGMGTTLSNMGVLSVFDGPKGKTVKCFYASTSNAGDFARLPVDLGAISAAIGKMLFE